MTSISIHVTKESNASSIKGNGMSVTEELRQQMAETDLLHLPSCPDALTARIALAAGFQSIYLGGYAFGALTTFTEPLTTMTELAEGGRNIAKQIDAPVIVDAGAGWGEPLHTMRAVRELVASGIAGAHLEDQQYPKRAHYHRDYQEHVAPWDEMALKFGAAVEARDQADPNFLLIGRTDAMKTHGYDEGIRRANAYLELGADVVMGFPNTREEALQMPKDVDGPVLYVNSVGNRVGRPLVATEDLETAGYTMCIDAIGTTLVHVRAMREAFEHLRRTGLSIVTDAEGQELRLLVEELVGLPEHYAVEERTVQPPS